MSLCLCYYFITNRLINQAISDFLSNKFYRKLLVFILQSADLCVILFVIEVDRGTTFYHNHQTKGVDV